MHGEGESHYVMKYGRIVFGGNTCKLVLVWRLSDECSGEDFV